MVDQDFGALPFVDEVKKNKEVIDLIRSEGGGVADPFAVSLFLIGWVSLGQADGLVIIRRHFVAKNESYFEFLGLGAGVEDIRQLLFRIFVVFHDSTE